MILEENIKEAVSKVTKLKKQSISLEIPKLGFGDFAFPCFDLAKKHKKNPKDIASEITKKIKKILPKEIEKIESVNGYINFSINKEKFAGEIINKIFKEKHNYGSLNSESKALIEHTSINPNASPHVGRIRNAIIGDILFRLLKFHGYKAEAHYYVNDVSKQMALLILGFKGNETFDDLLNLYVALSQELQRKPEFEKQIFEIIEKIEKGDKKTIAKLKKLVNIAVKGQKKILGRLGIFYDSFDYESMYLKGNRLKKILKQLEKTKRLKKDIEGRYVLDQSNLKWQFEKEMKSPIFVLTRSNGTCLYPMRDIVYTIDKLKSAPLNLIVLGEDQKLYFKQLSATLKLLGYTAPRVIHYSFVLVKTKKGAKKMATRKGKVILLSKFIDEAVKKAKQEIKKRKRDKIVRVDAVSEAIAIGAVRYSIAKVELNKDIVFSWDEALNFEGNSAPYLQYTYARAFSILKKLGKARLQKATYKVNNKEYNLVKELSNFPKIAVNSLDQLKPHLLCNYAYNLTQKFNDFYESCPVIKAEPEEKARRVSLVQTTLIVLRNVFKLLGLPVLEEM